MAALPQIGHEIKRNVSSIRWSRVVIRRLRSLATLGVLVQLRPGTSTSKTGFVELRHRIIFAVCFLAFDYSPAAVAWIESAASFAAASVKKWGSVHSARMVAGQRSS